MELAGWMLIIAIVLAVWELVWKAQALWKAARNNQRNWFITMLIVNTVGILPIIYLKFFQKKHDSKAVRPKSKSVE